MPSYKCFPEDIPVDGMIQYIADKIWKNGELTSDRHLLKTLFHKHDRDGSKALDPEEFHLAINSAGFHLSETQLSAMVSAIDINRSGVIKYWEFVRSFTCAHTQQTPNAGPISAQQAPNRPISAQQASNRPMNAQQASNRLMNAQQASNRLMNAQQASNRPAESGLYGADCSWAESRALKEQRERSEWEREQHQHEEEKMRQERRRRDEEEQQREEQKRQQQEWQQSEERRMKEQRERWEWEKEQQQLQHENEQRVWEQQRREQQMQQRQAAATHAQQDLEARERERLLEQGQLQLLDQQQQQVRALQQQAAQEVFQQKRSAAAARLKQQPPTAAAPQKATPVAITAAAAAPLCRHSLSGSSSDHQIFQTILEALDQQGLRLTDIPRIVDSGNSGVVSANELVSGLQSILLQIPLARASQLLCDYSASGSDSVVPTKEFAQLMHGQAQRLGVLRYGEKPGAPDVHEEQHKALLQQAKLQLARERSMPAAMRAQVHAQDRARVQRLRQDVFDKHNHMSAAYQRMDLDGNQGIDYREFQRGLARAGVKATELESMMLLLRFDRNCDGLLQQSEFVRMLQNGADADNFELNEHPAEALGMAPVGRSVAPHMPSGVSLSDSHSLVGARVQTEHGLYGVVRYAGDAEFASGEWLGVELDEPKGKNDGQVQGKRYFGPVAPQTGMFIRKWTAVLTPAKYL